jgi:putative Mn2+ efflux pump MntP
MVAMKMIALVLSLGMDTLMMSISLGMVETKGRVRIALTFAIAEALMPVVGFFLGKGAGQLIGDWAAIVGGLALLALAAWFIFFDDDDDGHGRNLKGWTLIVTAISISLDELAVGFSVGLVGVPIVLTIILITMQALFFTVLGLTFGVKLKPYFGEWSEKLAGIVLALLGLYVLAGAMIHLFH